ncbi:heat shock protein DnaJ domain-containing protein [Arthrobacter sp. PAMC 25486]|uniref:J domain-containing protein n=1 Tax=Arthrobacter sp. PAMC 25486 TaxID=1494608 RepID=UPI000535FC1B|nr:J domain-containing protein [Arthrobacter sp. PAMC 25486]AIY01326.1 heat shock protein DnaJ domain-containing protein [Arthrobacter sp. PAMC 25486]
MGEKFLTHYQVLGLARTATERDVKIAYRKAAKIAHPDRGGDPALFRQITQAYETLVDPVKRNAYDKSYGATGRSASSASTGSAHAHAREGYRGTYGSSSRAGSAGDTGFGGFNTRRAPEERRTAGDPAVYFPSYEGLAEGEVPLLPRPTAAQPVHGAPRKRGLFGATSRLAREARTAQLIMQQVLPGIPAARLINGVTAPFNSGYVDHVLVSGYRIAIVGSMLVPNGAFRWDGSTLVHGSKAVAPPQLIPATRQFQDLFPECNVTAWVCVHSNTGNLFEPVIDYARGTDPDGSNTVNVANAARFTREVKHFLASGPSPNVVDLSILDRLLGGMY